MKIKILGIIVFIIWFFINYEVMKHLVIDDYILIKAIIFTINNILILPFIDIFDD